MHDVKAEKDPACATKWLEIETLPMLSAIYLKFNLNNYIINLDFNTKVWS
jgi:hypothetical protein